MKIERATAFLCELPVERPRVDAIQQVSHQETIFVALETDEGVSGLGYGYTIGSGGRAVLAQLRHSLLDLIVGMNPMRPEEVWNRLVGATRFATFGPLVNAALAAVDLAVWDVRASALGLPLWELLGGARERVPIYDTDGGWLHHTQAELVDNALERKAQGWRAIKVKVGKQDIRDDLKRLEAVRDAIGWDMELMVDANQAFTLPEAMRRAHSWEGLGLAWFEEPLPAEDAVAHARLAEVIRMPVAVGEDLFSVNAFSTYLVLNAASILQPDAVRIGGITPWIKVAHLAEAFNVPVAPHYIMELSVSLVGAVANGMYVEHVPELRALTQSELRISNGMVDMPTQKGLGIAWDTDAIRRHRTDD